MENTKELYVGQTVAVAIIDESQAVLYDAVVLGTAATGASAVVMETKKCAELLKDHGAGYIQAAVKHDEECAEGKELGRRVKAENLHAFSKEASQLVAKFNGIASDRQKLTDQLKAVVAQLSAMAPKKEAKAEKKAEPAKK